MGLVLLSHIKPKGRMTRQCHSKKFIVLGAKTNTYEYSFISRTLNDWNYILFYSEGYVMSCRRILATVLFIYFLYS